MFVFALGVLTGFLLGIPFVLTMSAIVGKKLYEMGQRDQ